MSRTIPNPNSMAVAETVDILKAAAIALERIEREPAQRDAVLGVAILLFDPDCGEEGAADLRFCLDRLLDAVKHRRCK